jgi:exopolysaccharide production protein ExoZ
LYLTLTGAPNFYLNFASSPLPMEFIAGTGIGLLYVKRLFPAPRTAAAIAAAAAVATWAVIAHFHILLESANDINRVLAFGIPAALLVYGGVGLEVCGVFVAPRALQAVGDGSYAIYLWHLSILVALRQIIERLHLGGPIAHAAVLTVTFAIIIAFGMAVYRFFEKPVTDYLNAKLAQGFPLRSLDATVVARPLSQSVSD